MISARFMGAFALAVAMTFALSSAAASSVVSHQPPSGPIPAGEPLTLTVKIKKSKAFRRARVRYRKVGEKGFPNTADLKRAGKRTLEAVIPGAAIAPPGLEYLVIVQTKAGKVEAAAGTAKKPIRIEVEGAGGERGTTSTETKTETGGTSDTGTTGSGKPGEGGQSGSGTTGSAGEGGESGASTGEGGESAATGEGASTDAGEGTTSGDAADAAPVLRVAGAARPGRMLEGANVSTAEEPLDDVFAVYGAVDPSAEIGLAVRMPEGTIASHQVMERDAFANLPVRTLGDIVRLFPGMDTGRSVLGYERVSVRGLRDDPRIDLVIDGHRFHNPYDGRPYWDFPASLIERVEVTMMPGVDEDLRGGAAALVQVTTRRKEGFSGGAFGTTFLGGGGWATGGASFGSVAVHGGAHVEGERGPEIPLQEDFFTGTAYQSSPDDMVTNMSRVRGGANASVTAELGDTSVAWNNVAFGEVRGPTVGLFDTVGKDSSLAWFGGSSSLQVEQRVGGFLELIGQGYVDGHRADQTFQVTPTNYISPEGELFPEGGFVRRSYLALQTGGQALAKVHPLRTNTLATGLSMDMSTVPSALYALEANRDLDRIAQPLGPIEGANLYENGPCPMFGAAVPGLGACRLSMSAFVRDEQMILDRVRLSAGLRLVGYSDVPFDALSHLLPHLGIEVKVIEGLWLHAVGMTGMRPPTLEDKYDQTWLPWVDIQRGVFFGNPELQPEAFRNLEAGIRTAFEAGGVQYAANLNGFAYRADQIIAPVTITGRSEIMANAGSGLYAGADGGMSAAFADGSRVFANASWYRGVWQGRLDLDEENPTCKVFDGDPFADDGGEPCPFIPDVPQIRANAGAVVNFGPVGTVSVVGIFASERRHQARSTLERLRAFNLPAYGILNVGYRTPAFFDLVGFYVNAYNVLDAPVADEAPRPDRLIDQVPRRGIGAYGGLYLEL